MGASKPSGKKLLSCISLDSYPHLSRHRGLHILQVRIETICILHSPTDPQGLLKDSSDSSRTPPPLLKSPYSVLRYSEDSSRTPQGVYQLQIKDSLGSPQGVFRDFLEVDRFLSNEVSDKLDAIAES